MLLEDLSTGIFFCIFDAARVMRGTASADENSLSCLVSPMRHRQLVNLSNRAPFSPRLL